jgi:hypothetical protein
MDSRGSEDEESSTPTSAPRSVPTPGPISGSSSGDGCAAAASRSESKREKRNRKRRERKQRAKVQAEERPASEMDELEEEKGDDDFHPRPFAVELPERLLSRGGQKGEYARRLAAVRLSGGIVSIGSFRKLQALVEEDIQLLKREDRDWASSYDKLKSVWLQVCVSDADLPLDDEDGYSDDDVNSMDDL